MLPTSGKKKTALSIGTGGGVAERMLISNGWHVTCVDISKYSDQVMRNMLTKAEEKRYTFVHSSARALKITKKYDYIIASNSLPFEQKEHVKRIINTLYEHLNKNGVLVLTLFGYNTSLVQYGRVFGVNEDEARELLPVSPPESFKTYSRTYGNNQVFEIHEIVIIR
jgi:cyclopropane fatty-acyl-phospholipid synthase-like methyltransferase